uniref:Uncharacterized protein n=1 Tax=viral metagenome TaxID=1070528 RepID=A0A6M3IU99_9ZZZZ
MNSECEHVEALLDQPTPEEDDVPTWTMRDGTRIKVADMTTSHIENALAMLRRQGAVSPKAVYRSLYSEYHSDSLDFQRECQVLFSPRLCDMVDIFKDELKRREATPEGDVLS